MHPTDLVTSLAIMTACAAAITDWRTGHIPNWLTLGSLAAAPILWFGVAASHAGTLEAGFGAATSSLAGAFFCGVGPAFVFWRGGLGGGDVKLLAAIGALLGPRLGMNAELAAFVAAAIFVPGRLAWEGRLLRVVFGVARTLANPFVPRASRHAAPVELAARMRLGPAIFVGTLAACIHGSLAA